MTASKKVEYYTIDFYYNALEVVPKHHGDWVKAKDYESERTARLEAERKLKLIDHDNQKQCPTCEAETLTEDQKTVLSGVEVTAKIRKCSKCAFSWLPPSEESRIELVARKTLEARLAKCKEQRNDFANDRSYSDKEMSNLDQELEQITGE